MSFNPFPIFSDTASYFAGASVPSLASSSSAMEHGPNIPMPRKTAPKPPTPGDISWGKERTQADAALFGPTNVTANILTPNTFSPTPATPASTTPASTASASTASASITAHQRQKRGRKRYKEPDADAVAAAEALKATLSPEKRRKVVRKAKAATNQRERGAREREAEEKQDKEYDEEMAASKSRAAEWLLTDTYIRERPASAGVNWAAGLSGIKEAIEKLKAEKERRCLNKKQNDEILARCTPSQLAAAAAFEDAHPSDPNIFEAQSYEVSYYREWCAANGYEEEEEKEGSEEGSQGERADGDENGDGEN